MSSMQKELGPILAKATPEERSALKKILEAESRRPKHIYEGFWWQSQSTFDYYLEESGPSYSKIVCQVAEKLEIEHFGVKLEDIEIEIARKVFQTAWEKMTPEQRLELEDKLQEVTQEFDKGGELLGSASIFAALIAAKLSGFGVYLLASTALGTLTSIIGVTLPFAVYTTMSTAIGVILGPVGWIGAGLFAIWCLTGANYEKLIPAILYVSALRAKQQGISLKISATIVAETEIEQPLVSANRELVERMEGKIRAAIGRVWGKEKSEMTDDSTNSQ